jgi:CRP-like cAMP-binding protein
LANRIDIFHDVRSGGHALPRAHPTPSSICTIIHRWRIIISVITSLCTGATDFRLSEDRFRFILDALIVHGPPRRRLPPRTQEMALDIGSRSPNGFLSALTDDDFELMRPHLRTVDLTQDSILAEAGERLPRAYFPHRGVISLVVSLARGERVQVAMVGRDSVFGCLSALGGEPVVLNTATVLVPGTASVLDADRLRAAAEQSPTLRSLLFRHALAVFVQSQQTAGCNAAHTVESRLARCLLQTHDLSCGNKLYLTQESLAQMIGARRNSVSLVASTLQEANFIHYSRGHIEITDLEGLKKTTCECYSATKLQYDRLTRPLVPS